MIPKNLAEALCRIPTGFFLQIERTDKKGEPSEAKTTYMFATLYQRIYSDDELEFERLPIAGEEAAEPIVLWSTSGISFENPEEFEARVVQAINDSHGRDRVVTLKSSATLVDEFVESLRPDQMQRVVEALAPDQERLFRSLLAARVREQQEKDR